jgi:hypothetical protein
VYPVSDKEFPDAFAGCTERVRQYKPFILTEARKYSRRYFLKFAFVLYEAIRIAEHVEPKFDPGLGYDFSTFLRTPFWRGLTRYCKRQYRLNNRIMSVRQNDALARAGHPGFELHDREEREDWERQRRDLKASVGLDIGEYRKPVEPGSFDERRRAERERDRSWQRIPQLATHTRNAIDRECSGNYRQWKASIGPIGPNSVARLMRRPKLLSATDD